MAAARTPTAAADGAGGMDAPRPNTRVRAAASGFLHLLVSQVSTRLVTFGLNLLIARHLSPEAYGLSSVQFHLLLTTILLISREGFRRGCMRMADAGGAEGEADSGTGGGGGEGSSKAHAGGGGGVDSWRVLRVAALVVPLGALVSVAVCATALAGHDGRLARWLPGGGWLGGRPPPAAGAADVVPRYREAVLLHGVAAMIELLAEPFYILAAVHMQFGVRVGVEFASLLAKSGLTLALVARTLMPPALVFSAAQLACAGVLLAGYGAYGLRLLVAEGQRRRRRQQREPRRQQQGRQAKGAAGLEAHGVGAGALQPLRAWAREERPVLWTCALFTLQAVEKLALAEGSKLVLVATVQHAVDQGVYGLVSNLCGLAIRTLCTPLEEAAFTAFSAWGGSSSSSGAGVGSSDAAAAGAAATASGQGAAAPGSRDGAPPAHLAQLYRALAVMTKAVSVLGLLAVAFGPAYSYTALRLVYGLRWSETQAPTVLAAYCGYVLLTAVNGVGEAFVHAVLDARGLQQSNAMLLAFSAAHLAACVGLVGRHGALGMVAADAANMALRIAYSAWCTARFFRRLPSFSLLGLLPGWRTFGAMAAAAAATGASAGALMGGVAGSTPQRVFLTRAAAHVGVGVAALAAALAVTYRSERAAVGEVAALRRRGRSAAGGGGGGGGGGGAAAPAAKAKEE